MTPQPDEPEEAQKARKERKLAEGFGAALIRGKALNLGAYERDGLLERYDVDCVVHAVRVQKNTDGGCLGLRYVN